MTLAKPSVPANRQFAEYCCDLLSSVGHCLPKRMFGGWGISVDGLTLAIIADLGGGEKLWLKADEDSRGRFEAEGCERFTFQMKDRLASMGYYTAPEEAMDSPDAMRPWARLALECAVKARARKPPAKPRESKTAAPRKSRKA
jgi:DNA transformation protein and related proteins